MYNRPAFYIEDDYFNPEPMMCSEYEDEEDARIESIVLKQPVPSPHKTGIVYIDGIEYSEQVVELFDYLNIQTEVANAIVG